MLSAQGVAVIWAGGGIAAGAVVLRERSRWWIVLVPTALAIAAVWWELGSPLYQVVIRMMFDT